MVVDSGSEIYNGEREKTSTEGHISSFVTARDETGRSSILGLESVGMMTNIWVRRLLDRLVSHTSINCLRSQKGAFISHINMRHLEFITLEPLF